MPSSETTRTSRPIRSSRRDGVPERHHDAVDLRRPGVSRQQQQAQRVSIAARPPRVASRPRRHAESTSRSSPESSSTSAVEAFDPVAVVRVAEDAADVADLGLVDGPQTTPSKAAPPRSRASASSEVGHVGDGVLHAVLEELRERPVGDPQPRGGVVYHWFSLRAKPRVASPRCASQRARCTTASKRSPWVTESMSAIGGHVPPRRGSRCRRRPRPGSGAAPRRGCRRCR